MDTNSIVSELTTAEQEQVNAWCAQVAVIHAATEPLAADLPNMNGLTLDDRAALAFIHNTHELPEFPLSAPSWAVETKYYKGIYPSITIEHLGKEWATDDAAARLSQSFFVTVEGIEYHDGTMVSAGEIHREGVVIDAGGESYTLDAAASLSIALEGAVRDLARHTPSDALNAA
jgi:hypothetical protein